MNILKRLFIKLPLCIVFGIVILTAIIPFLYWVVTGGDLVEKLLNKLVDE